MVWLIFILGGGLFEDPTLTLSSFLSFLTVSLVALPSFLNRIRARSETATDAGETKLTDMMTYYLLSSCGQESTRRKPVRKYLEIVAPEVHV